MQDYGWMRKAGPALSIPFLIPISTLIGLLFGRWLDGKLGTSPWLAVVFGFFGFAGGIYEAIKILIQISRENGD